MLDYTLHEIIDMILILGERGELYKENYIGLRGCIVSDIQIDGIRRIQSFVIVFSMRNKNNLSDLGFNVIHRKQYD